MIEPEVHMFPCLQDNYGFLIRDHEANLTAVVDTPDVEAIMTALEERDWSLTHILNTHHHLDHAGGNLEIKQRTGCIVVGPRADAARIPGIDVEVGDGDIFNFGAHEATVYDTPGHTRGHIVYHFAAADLAFVGDTLFAMGCGRLFEGTPQQMWQSLSKIMQWPDSTRLYCAHEYTQSNGRFALSVEPDNQALVDRCAEVDRLRSQGQPTVPTTLGLEKATNPFLRPESSGLQAGVGLPNGELIEVFARTRQLKDNFRG